MTQFHNISACVFDAYGTLFDVHSAVRRHYNLIGDNADQLSALWRTKQLEYSWLRSLMGRYENFYKVTEEALAYAFNQYKIKDPDLKDKLLSAYMELDCYDEVPEVLSNLKKTGITVSILSNGSPEMLYSAVSSSGIADSVDSILSVEAVKVYKPDPKVYRMVTDQYNLSAQQVLFFSSNAWDAAGAASFGFNVAWVNRFNGVKETLPFEPHIELASLETICEFITK